MTEINQERLSRVTFLARGAHQPNDEAMCAMEAVAWIAGEKWSDHPQCVCPVIGEFMRSWNDSLPDDKRTALLLPLIPLAIGTRGSDALANRRANMVSDWFIRVHVPAWLRLAGLTAQADLLASMPEITDYASLLPTLTSISSEAIAARDAAGAAAWAAAGDAAWIAAGAAARDAAGAAAWAAAGVAARDAAGAAAWATAGVAAWDDDRDVAWEAAWDARRAAAGAAAWAASGTTDGTTDGAVARAAAWDILASTVTELQASAVDLVRRMCALADADGSGALR